MSQLKFGIIGLGQRGLSYGHLLTNGLSGYGRVMALADINEKRMNGAARLLGLDNMALYSNYHDLLADPTIDAVIVTTPDCTHETVATDALRAGKHVLCEKPLATTVEGSYKIMAAQKPGQVLQIGFVLRYNRVYENAYEIIARGDIGNVKQIIATDNRRGADYFRRWHRFREKSGGLFNHKSTHTLDIVNWYAGAKPVSISAMGGLSVYLPGKWQGERCLTCETKEQCPEYLDLREEPYRSLYLLAETADGYIRDTCTFTSEKTTIDHGHALIEYDNDVKASYNLSLFAPIDTRQMMIFGDRGKLELDEAQRRITVRPHYSQDVIEYSVAKDAGGHGGGDTGLLREFIACMKQGEQPLAGAVEGAWSCLVSLAAEQSVDEKRPITIAEMLQAAGVSDGFPDKVD